MPEMPTEEFAVWLLNPRRGRRGLPLLFAGTVVGLFSVVAILAWLAPGQYLGLGIGSWALAALVLYHRFTKWASDAATAVVGPRGLAVHSGATGYRLAVSYDAVRACVYGTAKYSAWLRIDYPDSTSVLLQASYGQKTFGAMAASCERHCKAHWQRAQILGPRAPRQRH
jgi:hypothetical protein